MASFVYNQFKNRLLQGGSEFLGGEVHACLIDTTYYTPGADDYHDLTDLPSNAIVTDIEISQDVGFNPSTGGVTLLGTTYIDFPEVDPIEVNGVLFYLVEGSSKTLVSWHDDVLTSDGGTVRATFANGLFNFDPTTPTFPDDGFLFNEGIEQILLGTSLTGGTMYAALLDAGSVTVSKDTIYYDLLDQILVEGVIQVPYAAITGRIISDSSLFAHTFKSNDITIPNVSADFTISGVVIYHSTAGSLISWHPCTAEPDGGSVVIKAPANGWFTI